MEKFERLVGVAAPLLHENINTDAIIPVPWIVNYGRDLGEGLFGGWRYLPGGGENPDFILNQPPFRDSRIVLAAHNFGCGSSREEAVWALSSFGIRCVIAPSFGDIFFENAFKNGLLPMVLHKDEVAILARESEQSNHRTIAVDLEACTVGVPGGTTLRFAVDPGRRKALLMGLDHVDLTLARLAEISSFQAADRDARPWIHRASQRQPG